MNYDKDRKLRIAEAQLLKGKAMSTKPNTVGME